MKKNLFATLFVILLISCSSENNFLPNSDVVTKSTFLPERPIELSHIALLLATADINIDAINEVKEVVENSIYYGQDETCRFKDLLMPDSSKIFHTTSKKLIQKIEDAVNTKEWAFNKENLFDYLSKNNIQIYWPYSERWDSTTRPIVTYYSNDKNKWNYGYQQILQTDGTIKIDTIIVDENYFKNNPIWIINQNKTPYEDLPNFQRGEYVNKSGTIFFSEAFKKNQKQTKDIIMLNTSVFIGYVNCLNSSESKWNGAPELKFTWGHIGYNTTGAINTLSIQLTLNEIGHAKEINSCIQPSWTTFEKTNSLFIVEEDKGKSKTMTKNLTYWDDRLIPVSIPYKNNDDILFDQILVRSDIFSDKNKPFGQWKQYHGNDFWFTLPTQ